MDEISARIRLRPTRIALLVDASDIPSIRKFMEVSACLWGGAYNPIIPVARPAQDCRDESSDSGIDVDVVRGYVEFFEPDVFVEAAPGLLETAGLGSLRRERGVSHHVLSLDSLLSCDSRSNHSYLEVGLTIIDVLRHVYEAEQRFQLREPRSAFLVQRGSDPDFVPAVFGLYPDDEASRYFARSYQDVFDPSLLEPTPDTWLRVYTEDAVTPLRITRYKLETSRSWRDGPRFFVFDPGTGADLIELWNLRLESAPVLPVPIDWWSDLAAFVSETAGKRFAALPEHVRGVASSTTIEFSRSISCDRREESLAVLDGASLKGPLSVHSRRTPIRESYFAR